MLAKVNVYRCRKANAGQYSVIVDRSVGLDNSHPKWRVITAYHIMDVTVSLKGMDEHMEDDHNL